MTIELEKLSPAPWYVQQNRDHPTASPFVCRPGEGGIAVMQWLCHEQTPEAEADMIRKVEVNAEFIALARNAFDVMMRRAWYSVPRKADASEWIVLNAFAVELERGGNTGVYFTSSDPFSCLVEAEDWYRDGPK